MNAHLSDEQWFAAVLNENDQAAAEHLARCPACRKEVHAFVEAAAVAQAQTSKMTERPETFWRRQRESIKARVAARDFTHPWKRWTWVTATVVLVVLASTLLSRNRVPPVQATAQTDPDNALLLTVQRSIQSDVPQALRPVALLARQIERAEAAR